MSAPIPFGPNPWHQTSWDARAAGNFVCGGAGAGLVVFTALAGLDGSARAALLLAGLALVALGLFCVFLELGRPLRMVNVVFNPRTSWMSREALAAGLLFALGLATAFGVLASAWSAAVVALAFVYCQARLLQASKGIPAWREPLLVPLLVVTGLAEGGGFFLVGAPTHGMATPGLLIAFGVLVAARLLLWRAYRRRLTGRLSVDAALALDLAGRLLQLVGTIVPLAVAAIGVAGVVPAAQLPLLAAIGGLAAAIAGGWMKFVLVTRAGYNQGFALPHVPVRGQPH